MTRRDQLKNKRISKIVGIILICIICIFAVIKSFEIFSNNIEKELDTSAGENIEETYKEVGQLVTEISRSRINYLKMLGDYFNTDAIIDNEDFIQTVEKYRNICEFTQFYFINEDSYCRTIDGVNAYIDLGDTLNNIESSDGIIVDGSLPTRDEMIFYVVDVPNGEFDGFNFTAIAFGYDKLDMVNSLEIEAYNGNGIAYLIYNNGKIICRIDSSTKANNIYTILDYSTISDVDYKKVEDDITNYKTGTIKIEGDNVEGFGEYYFSYQPLDYQDWILVSMVETSEVNKVAELVSGQTKTVFTAIFACIMAVVITGLVFTFRNAIKNKDGLIIQRNIVFDLVCNNLDEIYILFNTLTKQVEYVSPNTEKLVGISHDDIYDNPNILNIYNHGVATPLDKLISNFIEKELYDFRDDVYLKAPHGKQMVLYSLTTYRKENDLYGVVVLSDRTEENRIRQELQDALDGAKSANEAKTAFLSNVSHDMRTPMNAIVGFSNLIEKDPSDASKVMDYIMKIKLSSHHLLNLINEVLDYSKIEAGKTTLNLEPANIETVVNSIDSLIRPQTLEKGQTFNVNRDFKVKGMVNADELRLSQILINILSNSIKYTPSGGTINFNVTNEKYHQFIKYTFVIEDNGVGMSKEFASKIFEPFSREEDSTTNKIQGTGLGMSITKNLIDLMGGTIDLETEKGKGSKFTVTIYFEKVEDMDETRKLELSKEEIDYSLEGLNILAAEDNALNAEIIKAIIEAEGAHIEIAENGKECLDKFEASKPHTYDLILMDVQMPIMDGYDATMAIRNSKHEDAKNIPIIAMTANAFIEDVNNSLKAGMNAHVSKPIDMNILKRTIKECLEKNK